MSEIHNEVHKILQLKIDLQVLDSALKIKNKTKSIAMF